MIREYKEAIDKEKKIEVRKRFGNFKGKICIGSFIKNFRINFIGENILENFKNWIYVVNLIGRLITFVDERRRLLLIVVMDYLYRLF